MRKVARSLLGVVKSRPVYECGMGWLHTHRTAKAARACEARVSRYRRFSIEDEPPTRAG